MSKTLTLEERFWQHVDKRGDDECWLWTGKSRYTHPFTGEPTYGFLKIDHRHRTGAHRISWSLHNNQEIPRGMCVLHKCDNPICVNPSHLFLGTHNDNMQDKVRKGRAAGGANKGEINPLSKLTDAKVVEILKLLKAKVPRTVICQQFNVSRGTIDQIATGRTWRHVPRD